MNYTTEGWMIDGCEQVDGEEGARLPGPVGQAGAVPAVARMDHPVEWGTSL